jgi:hypothetical protein
MEQITNIKMLDDRIDLPEPRKGKSLVKSHTLLIFGLGVFVGIILFYAIIMGIFIKIESDKCAVEKTRNEILEIETYCLHAERNGVSTFAECFSDNNLTLEKINQNKIIDENAIEAMNAQTS